MAVIPEGCVFLSEGMAPLSGRQVGLVPGAEAPLLAVTPPARLRGFAREQVGFRQLRDALGQKALELRPFEASAAAGSGPKGMWTRALAADRAAATRWRAMAGPGGRAVLPDYLALPAAADLWVLAVTEGGLLARLGPGDGFSAPLALASRQMQAALAAGPVPKAVLWIGAVPEGVLEVTAQITAQFEAREIPVLSDPAALAKLGIAPPKRFAHGELALDLRRDPGAARAALARRVLPWRWPLLAGLLAVALWSATQMLVIDRLEAREKAFRDDTLARVRVHFVPTGPILDVRVQVAQALAAAEAASGGATRAVSPLDLFERAAAVIHAQGAKAESLNYLPQEGLAAVVLVADFAAAEALATALRAAGLTVRLIEARVEAGDGGRGGANGAPNSATVRAELRLTLDPEGE